MIKFVSYNIRKSLGTDRRRQPERIMQILGELDADIVALQEVDRRFGQRATTLSPELIVDFTGYMPVRFGIREQSLGWHGNVLLVKKGLQVTNQQRIELPAFEPRGAVMADVTVGHERIRVVGMHLGLIGNWRLKQAEAVVGYLEKLEDRMPTVIMGDLNQWAQDGGCLAEFARHHDIIPLGPSFHSRRPMLPLDRIITSRDFRLEGAGVHRSALARTGSDHLPVWAALSLARAEAAA
ncbi:MAG: endonuclease/exonuclease/phosphatase family protein [Devosia sp.]|uniref:endonuclease/exonuclease/phosphatase family protein n=1 Tax=Devosia sp. TaxID=1871048 RepID=UPI001AC6C3B6|nr:endonuclease/exonuclease/phosphatase family protein [Devosia sp.]MBN9308567.1 endonuclease/exonuclease/phosphatase family protein [Devosia sp.]MBN9314624.1 endonuclease/exonuclease/phosphatase family protein [Devosia sp.]